jgi:hypothetical protein
MTRETSIDSWDVKSLVINATRLGCLHLVKLNLKCEDDGRPEIWDLRLSSNACSKNFQSLKF